MKPFIINNKTKFLFAFLIILAIVLLFYIVLEKDEMENSAIASKVNFQNHPIYSHYVYNLGDNVINIGFQPLYLPTGIIFEVIKRDKILQEALHLLEKEIIFFPYLKGLDLNHFLQQNDIIGGVGGDMPALTAASNIDIIIPAILQSGVVSIVSGKQMLTNDLKGKRIAFPDGSIAHYFLLDLLQDSGIEENEVELIPMDVASMAEALHNKKIDLFAAWEPAISEAKKQHPGVIITYKRISTGYIYFSKEFAVKNPEAVNHILAAVVRAINWIKDDRENLILACQWNIIEMDKLTGKKNILIAEEIADLAMDDIFRYYSNSRIFPMEDDLQINSNLYNEFEFLKNSNFVPASSQWNKVSKSFDTNLMREISNQQIKYSLNEFDYDVAL